MWVLISHLRNPPGSYPYTQTTGIHHKFPATSDIKEQARIVADFRAGNGLPRATFAEALYDVDTYQCERLGYMREYCYNTDQTYEAVTPALRKPSGGCGGCGAKV